MRNAALLEHLREIFGLLDGDGADQDRLPLVVELHDLLDGRLELLLLGLVDDVGVVDADHRPVGRDDHDVELVDLVELGRLGVGGAGHAGELVVHAEIVLEGDGGQGLVLALDLDPFLGLHRLVQAVAPAPPRHQPAGEFVDDHHLAVLDHVVDVALEQGVGLEGLVDVVQDLDVLRLVEVIDAEQLLDPGHPLLGQGRGLGLFVDGVIAGIGLQGLAEFAVAVLDDLPLLEHGDHPVDL